MKKYLVALCLVVGMAAAHAGEFPDISVNDLEKAIKDGKVTVLDVNRDKTYAKGHIPGAVHFPTVDDLSKILPEDKEALVVAYCGGPKCKAYKKGASAAAKLGYKNVKHLSAGISGWKKAGIASSMRRKSISTPSPSAGSCDGVKWSTVGSNASIRGMRARRKTGHGCGAP